MKIIGRGRQQRPLVRALRHRRSLRGGLVQLLYVCAGLAAGLMVPRLDLGPRIDSAGVTAILAGITAGLLALVGIVFALLFVVVIFAARSQSPRLHLFRDHPLVWQTLGLIVGVLVYAATSAVVAASTATTTVLVPISVLVLVLLSVAVTRRLQLQALQLLQLSPVLEKITFQSRAVIDGLYPAGYPGPATPVPPAPGHIVQIRWPGRQRVLRQIDLPGLIDLARRNNAIVRLLVLPGDLVREDAVVLEVWDSAGVPEPLPLLRCLEVGIDRDTAQDPLLGFRLLNDIALRAMSTADNDPATAVQALDCIESLLRVLAVRDLAIGVVTDDDDAPRVLLNSPDWETFLSAGTDEIFQTPMHPVVRKRLRVMLDQVLVVTPAERRSPVDRYIAALDQATDTGVAVRGQTKSNSHE